MSRLTHTQRFGILFLGTFILVIFCLIILYFFEIGLTGFESKRIWDWLELLVIPIVLAGGALYFNAQARKTERTIAQEQHYIEILRQYLESMKELVIDNILNSSEARDQMRAIARAITLTALQEVDGRRKGLIIRFLYEAKLILRSKEAEEPIISLSRADLSDADLSGTNLSGSELSETILDRAIFISADLTNANLSGSLLTETDFRSSSLTNADLSDAFLLGTRLKDANLHGLNIANTLIEDLDISLNDLTLKIRCENK